MSNRCQVCGQLVKYPCWCVRVRIAAARPALVRGPALGSARVRGPAPACARDLACRSTARAYAYDIRMTPVVGEVLNEYRCTT